MRNETRGQNSLAVVVICTVVTMPVHRPCEVFFEPVGMTVLGDHLNVLLESLEDRRRVGRRRHDRPYHDREAKKPREHMLSDCSDRLHRSCLFHCLVQRVSRYLALSSRGG